MPSIVENAESFIRQLLTEKLSADHRFHDLQHTLSVRDAALLLGRMRQLPEDQLQILTLASLLHDTGFTKQYQDHETTSRQIAEAFLEEQGFDAGQISQVLQLIEATRPTRLPQTPLEELIRDADLNNLGKSGYGDTIDNLRHEWEIFLDRAYTDEEWYKENTRFLEQHRFFTPEARQLFGDQKASNLKKTKKKAEKAAQSAAVVNRISESKPAQMILKTALRNHIDLTSIADNKANIMLSINALIITISMPLLAGNIKGNTFLILPAGILLVTCVLSIIFATLATRPIPTPGITALEKVGKESTNLFFFGNFHKMDFKTYKSGLSKVMADEEILDESIMSDLFYLGKTLGRKFNQLRVCYGIFMVGITLTVLAFVGAFIWSR